MYYNRNKRTEIIFSNFVHWLVKKSTRKFKSYVDKNVVLLTQFKLIFCPFFSWTGQTEARRRFQGSPPPVRHGQPWNATPTTCPSSDQRQTDLRRPDQPDRPTGNGSTGSRRSADAGRRRRGCRPNWQAGSAKRFATRWRTSFHF